MARYKLRNARPKALFGESLAAAGIMAAASLAGAEIGRKATVNAAKEQADAIIKNAQETGKNLKLQNDNANQLQQQNIEFTKQQNEENRRIAQETQTLLQMQQGYENTKNRQEASKIVLRNGGQLPRRGSVYSLRGKNMPFQVTDGGGVSHLGKSKDGFDVYEIVGDTHKQYHKTKGGKYKSGVGIKFANGNVVEGEGDKDTGQGELLVNTPQSAYFLSKHSIRGFNPSKAVLAGMDPIRAFNLQEAIKDRYGITNSGKQAKCGKRVRRLNGGGNNSIIPTMDMDYNNFLIGPMAVAAARPTLKNGGRVKAKTGWFTGWNKNDTGNLVGAGISALGNIGGALIGASGARKAGQIVADANNQAASILANYYSKLKGIDMSAISKDDYRITHYMPTIRSANVNINPELTTINRSTERRRRNAERNSISGAAYQEKLNNIEMDAIDARNSIYATKANAEEQIKQQNAAAITEAAKTNAMLDQEVNKDYTTQKLAVLQYNNDIENQKIIGTGQAYADALTSGAQARGNARLQSSAMWADAFNNIGSTAANTLSTIGKNMVDYDYAFMGLSDANKTSELIRLGDADKAKTYYDIYSQSVDENQRKYAQQLDAKFGFSKQKKGRINANAFSINVNPYSGSYFSNRVNRLRNVPLQ